MIEKTLTQGSVANVQGRILEKTIVPTFQARGFQVASYKDWLRNQSAYGTELLLKNVPYTTIYNHEGRTEFLVLSERYNLNVRIECKWQQSSGSVDEKFPYLYLNCILAVPEQDIIIIVGGGGMKPGSLTWLKNAVKERLYQSELLVRKNIQVLSLDDFLSWTNKVLR